MVELFNQTLCFLHMFEASKIEAYMNFLEIRTVIKQKEWGASPNLVPIWINLH